MKIVLFNQNISEDTPGNAIIMKQLSQAESMRAEEQIMTKQTPHMKQPTHKEELQQRDRLRTSSKKTTESLNQIYWLETSPLILMQYLICQTSQSSRKRAYIILTPLNPTFT